MSVIVRTIESPGLGDRSYLVHDGSSALAIDPPRDIDRMLAAAAEDDVRIEAVFETHVHNDYVSGGLALARRTGATLVAHRDDDRSFEVHGVVDGDVVAVGELEVEAWHSPGHTPTHLAYVVRHGGRPRAVFTGGSLLYGTVGRTDLHDDADDEEMTRRQWATARRLVAELPDDTDVYPTHGFGSFCSAQAGADRDSGTIGDEHDNPAVTTDDADEFVRELLAGLTDAPAYYAHMAHLNRAGVAEPDLSPVAEVDIGELAARLEAGEWVVDLRDRRAYAGRHLVGSFNFEEGNLPTHLGWLMPWGARLTLLATDRESVADAQRALSRIGVDRPGGGDLGAALDELPTADYGVVDYAELAEDWGNTPAGDRDGAVLDVRRRDEFEQGHLDGAVNIPLHELLDHLHHVPAGPLRVHCASGARASIAASVLARAGFDVTLADGGPDS